MNNVHGPADRICRYVPHKGALTWEQAREFVSSIRTGSKSAVKLRSPLGPLKEAQAWDGKDGVADVQDEFSLDDIMGEM